MAIFVLAHSGFSLDTQTITARPVIFTGDENAGCASTLLKRRSLAMQLGPRFRQTLSRKDRLEAFALEAREQASHLPIGIERDAILKKARQADTAAHIDEWANSPGLRLPK